MKKNTKPRLPGWTSLISRGVFRPSRALSTGRILPSLGFIALLAAVPVSMSSSRAVEPGTGTADAGEGASPVTLPPETVVAGLHREDHARVEYWVRRFSTDQRPTFELFLAQEGAFGELIRQKLRDRKMPEELLYMAMIESGLRPGAVSRVEAVGVWQFMGPTAEAYGLRVDEWVDERRDPVKATDAALDYLEWLYGRYQSWYLAAAAYNAGPTRVDQALRRSRIGIPATDSAFWTIRSMLPKETREYIPRLLAATRLAEAPQANGFHGIDGELPYEFDQVWVPGGTALRQVASRLGVEHRMLWALNPHLVRGKTPPGEAFPLRVPVGSAFQVVASLGSRPWSKRLADD